MEDMQTTEAGETGLVFSSESDGSGSPLKDSKKKDRKELFHINTHPGTVVVAANNKRDLRLKQIVMHVVAFCKREHEEGQLVPFRFFKKRASLMTGVSLSTIHRIETIDMKAPPSPPPPPPPHPQPPPQPQPESGSVTGSNSNSSSSSSKGSGAKTGSKVGGQQQKKVKKKRKKKTTKEGDGGTTTTTTHVNGAVLTEAVVGGERKVEGGLDSKSGLHLHYHIAPALGGCGNPTITASANSTATATTAARPKKKVKVKHELASSSDVLMGRSSSSSSQELVVHSHQHSIPTNPLTLTSLGALTTNSASLGTFTPLNTHAPFTAPLTSSTPTIITTLQPTALHTVSAGMGVGEGVLTAINIQHNALLHQPQQQHQQQHLQQQQLQQQHTAVVGAGCGTWPTVGTLAAPFTTPATTTSTMGDLSRGQTTLNHQHQHPHNPHHHHPQVAQLPLQVSAGQLQVSSGHHLGSSAQLQPLSVVSPQQHPATAGAAGFTVPQVLDSGQVHWAVSPAAGLGATLPAAAAAFGTLPAAATLVGQQMLHTPYPHPLTHTHPAPGHTLTITGPQQQQQLQQQQQQQPPPQQSPAFYQF